MVEVCCAEERDADAYGDGVPLHAGVLESSVQPCSKRLFAMVWLLESDSSGCKGPGLIVNGECASGSDASGWQQRCVPDGAAKKV